MRKQAAVPVFTEPPERPTPPEMRRVALDELQCDDGGFWVFGYGSLMWNPGFRHVDRRHAALSGFARRFCLWSVRYRGTPESPGLVLGLAQAAGSETRGVAFRVAGRDADETLAYLAERELVTAAYHEVAAPVRFTCRPEAPERAARAVAYVVDQQHRQFTGDLSLDQQAEIIAGSRGGMGPNADYLFNTAAHLQAIGVEDPDMGRLVELVRERLGEAAGAGPIDPSGPDDPVGD